MIGEQWSNRQGRANLQERLISLGQFHADQVALDDRQPGSLQNLSPLFGLVEQKPYEGTLRRIGY